ncbi:hypothetical protein RvY_09617 [Ramazzottius varieornatus]|uniref:Uncharacterized protein n=1 Tax=Ramazzottius varieornatus TaxID=947166 RepID=A0A1D1VFE7_RAMVA|nr:hypothetical protein RvY_09617 [Ramazzottius varieornatus]
MSQKEDIWYSSKSGAGGRKAQHRNMQFSSTKFLEFSIRVAEVVLLHMVRETDHYKAVEKRV